MSKDDDLRRERNALTEIQRFAGGIWPNAVRWQAALAASIDRVDAILGLGESATARSVEQVAQIMHWRDAEIERLTAERDARPNITPEDAAVFARMEVERCGPPGNDAVSRMRAALREHAKRAKS